MRMWAQVAQFEDALNLQLAVSLRLHCCDVLGGFVRISATAFINYSRRP